MNNDGSLQQKTWSSPCFDQFRVREWEDESFLFNPVTGDTHVLNALSIEILKLLSQRRLSADALVNELPDAFGSIEFSLKRDQLIEYLQQFEAMGLIVSSQSCD